MLRKECSGVLICKMVRTITSQMEELSEMEKA